MTAEILVFPGREPSEEKIPLLYADPHQWGPGKVHRLRPGAGLRSLCGQTPDTCPGRLLEGVPAAVTCLVCLRIQERLEARLEARRAALRAYHQTPRWLAIKQAIYLRSAGLCEICHDQPPAIIQWKISPPDAWPGSWAWTQAERLEDLLAVCRNCYA